MKRTPRRQRARAKAWVYLALFGPDEEPFDEEVGPRSDDRSEGDLDDSESQEDEP